MTYCIDQDLLKYRDNILSLGVDDWETQREDAYSIINRQIIARWYNRTAPLMGVDPTVTFFDPDLVADGSLTRLECFKTLEFAYMLLMKDSQEADGFERNMALFAKQYGGEFDSIIGMGLSYDWSDDGTIDDDEVAITAPRRLIRS